MLSPPDSGGLNFLTSKMFTSFICNAYERSGKIQYQKE